MAFRRLDDYQPPFGESERPDDQLKMDTGLVGR